MCMGTVWESLDVMVWRAGLHRFPRLCPSPEAKKTMVVLSGIMNFIHFRKLRMEMSLEHVARFVSFSQTVPRVGEVERWGLISICLSLSLCPCFSLCLYAYHSLCLSPPLCLLLSLSRCLSLSSPRLFLTLCCSACLSLCLPVCLSVSARAYPPLGYAFL